MAQDSRNGFVHTLVLFDIDGTILTTGGCGERALRLAIRDYFEVEDHLETLELAGRTDTHIARQLLEKYQRPVSDESVRSFLDFYVKHLAELLPQIQGRVFPGVVELLEIFEQRDDVAVGLLTGNIAKGAELKLSRYGVWQFFRFGAFADDHFNRNELGPVARRRAQEHHQSEFAVDRTFVIGDTEHDVACARAIGAKAVAVATGGSSHKTLAGFSPDLLFHDLGNTAEVMKAFGLSE